MATVDVGATARWLGRAFGVPGKLIRAQGVEDVEAVLNRPPVTPANR